MAKNLAAAVAIGGLLAFGTVAHAADTKTHTIRADQMRASKVIGADVYDVHNQKIGDVQDIILDKDGRVADVVVDVGSFLGMGGKNVAVNLNDMKTDHNRLTLDRTKDQLKQAAAYQLTDRDTGAGKSASPVIGGQAGSSGSSMPPRTDLRR
jgi:sporulation protein YlmC with PRC-barrel domain